MVQKTKRSWHGELLGTSGHIGHLETEDKKDQGMANRKNRRQEGSGHGKQEGTEENKDQGIENSYE
jgi:hypothetical protein